MNNTDRSIVLQALSRLEDGVIRRIKFEDLLRQITMIVDDPHNQSPEAPNDVLYITCVDVTSFDFNSDWENIFTPESLWGINEFALCKAGLISKGCQLDFDWEGGRRKISLTCKSVHLDRRTIDEPLEYPYLDSTRVPVGDG